MVILLNLLKDCPEYSRKKKHDHVNVVSNDNWPPRNLDTVLLRVITVSLEYFELG